MLAITIEQTSKPSTPTHLGHNQMNVTSAHQILDVRQIGDVEVWIDQHELGEGLDLGITSAHIPSR